jgi:hypothetical protein
LGGCLKIIRHGRLQQSTDRMDQAIEWNTPDAAAHPAKSLLEMAADLL